MKRIRGAGGAAVLLVAGASPGAAQVASPVDQRIERLEKELGAVQRRVFPGGTVQPELTQTTGPAVAAGSPASAPIADLTARVDALERQLATGTGANEQAGFRVRQLEESVARLQSRLSALETAGAASPVGSGTVGSGGGAAETQVRRDEIVEPARTTASSRPRTPQRPAGSGAAGSSATRADPARREAVAAVEMPSTGNAVEDEYTYGFRLYSAKLYPEAQARLKAFTQGHPPSNKRWSYAQNLLGRAYLDEGKPALASVALYDNYQKAPRGERASESLYWLGRALTKLNKLADACKVYDELADVYGAKLDGAERTRMTKGRADAKCTG